MNYERFFEERISSLKAEGRYRVFTEIMRRVSHFPEADQYTPQGQTLGIVIRQLQPTVQRLFSPRRITSYNVCYTKLLRSCSSRTWKRLLPEMLRVPPAPAPQT